MAYKKPRLSDRESVVEDVRSAQTFTRLGLLIQKQEETNESVKGVADGLSEIKGVLVDSAESTEDTNKGIDALTNVFSDQLDFMKQEKLNNAGDLLEGKGKGKGKGKPPKTELKGFAKFLNMFKKGDKKDKKGTFGLLKKILIFGGIFTAILTAVQGVLGFVKAFSAKFDDERLVTVVDDSMGRTATLEEMEGNKEATLRRLAESNVALGKIIQDNTDEQKIINEARAGMGKSILDGADNFADGLEDVTSKLGLTFGNLLKGMGFEEAGEAMITNAYKTKAKESFGSRRDKKRRRNEIELLANSREDEEIDKLVEKGELTEKQAKKIRNQRDRAQGRGFRGIFMNSDATLRSRLEGESGRVNLAMSKRFIDRYKDKNEDELPDYIKLNLEREREFVKQKELFDKGELEFTSNTEYETMLQEAGLKSNAVRQLEMIQKSEDFRMAGINPETMEGEQYTRELVNNVNKFNADTDADITPSEIFKAIEKSKLDKTSDEGGTTVVVDGKTDVKTNNNSITNVHSDGQSSPTDSEPKSFAPVG